jgi:hypothetical protein
LTEKIEITWATAGVSYSRVYRSLTNDAGTATAITEWLQATSYEDTEVEMDQHYFYFVRVSTNINGSDPSPFSVGDEGYALGEVVTGVEDVADRLFAMYPNPVTDVLQVKAIRPVACNITLQIVNVLGETSYLLETGLSSDLFIDLSAFPSGQYLVIIQGADGMNVTRKIVKH